MKEIWKEIPNTKGMYYASQLGNIKSADRERRIVSHGSEYFYMRHGRVLKKAHNSYGYPVVTIHVPGQHQKVIAVHILVARTFIPNPEGKPQINHIDGNKDNCCVSNLEWCTAQENLLHAFRTGLNPGSSPWTGITGKDNCRSKPIIMYSKDGEELARFVSLTAAEDATPGALSSHISSCAKGKRKYCAGYMWAYAED